MFYEHTRSAGDRYIFCSNSSKAKREFPLHLHKSYELIIVREGQLNVRLGTETYNLNQGESILVFPMQVHGFSSTDECSICLCIFSQEYLPELTKGYEPVFQSIPDFYERYLKISNRYYALKSLLYQVAEVYSSGEIKKYDEEDEELLSEIVKYIDANFTKDISLDAMAKHFGYSYRYMSGVFNRHFKNTFPVIINQFRIRYACNLVREKKVGITEIAGHCGFDSQRNFNRVFKQITGMTPREMRNN